MTSAQKNAVRRHRKRQANKGVVRVEVSIPEQDRELIRAIAAELRNGGSRADQVRMVLSSSLAGEELLNFKQYLEMAPLENIEFARSRDSGTRDLDF